MNLLKNLYIPSVYGIGYIGQGIFKPSLNCKITKVYSVWADMLKRGYNIEYKEKHPTYKDVTVCEEWHNFQNFAEWFEENYIDGFTLDKDIFCKNCKLYSPETCCFVPQQLNKILTINRIKKGIYPTGVNFNKQNNKFVAKIKKYNKTIFLGYFNTSEDAFNTYKIVKEVHIKEVADIWKDMLAENVYQAIINYKIT